MSIFNMKYFDMKKEPQWLKKNIPAAPRNLSSWALGKSHTTIVYYKNKFVFCARVYYITKNYAQVHNYLPGTRYEIGEVFLMPEYRGLGFARGFLNKFIRWLASRKSNLSPPAPIMLWTTRDNTKAINLYKKLGFEETKIIPDVHKIAGIPASDVIALFILI